MEGWLHTGDIATVDSSGQFTIVDRLKELIKVRLRPTRALTLLD